ncbi:calcium-binding EF-hand family protein [Tanacetum coccineum]
MGVILIDGSTVRSFVNDEQNFKLSIDSQFTSLDTNKDGVLSRSEMRKAFESMHLLETHFGVYTKLPPEELTRLYDLVFVTFDGDHNGTVDREEFGAEMKIMLAIADGLGSSPIQTAVEDDDH